MKIQRIENWEVSIKLTRPYKITRRVIDSVQLYFVRVVADQGTGLGSASPFNAMSKETPAICAAVLGSDEVKETLVDRDPRHLGSLTRAVRDCDLFAEAPAARSALDMALYDLYGNLMGVSVSDLLGRCHDGLPTSITIGIKGVEETLEEAKEYIARGFNHLKVKLGDSIEVDIERLQKLREQLDASIKIRVDANEGYNYFETSEFMRLVADLQLEFVEQPLPARKLPQLRELAPESISHLALDENLQGTSDALELAASPPLCRVFNIKLMKCGGITAGRTIADIAELAKRDVMWGCFDESIISISAALHAAYASPATRYLDLDGHLDLATDPAVGDFEIRDGRMFLGNAPGLGVRLTGDAG